MNTQDFLKSIGMDKSSMPILDSLVEKPISDDVEWEKRVGRITGSQFHRIGWKNGQWTDGAETYMCEKIWEWITGEQSSRFSGSQETDWGNEWEPMAIDIYEQKTGYKVSRGKFYIAEQFQGLIGCTPDGVSDDVGLEVKCPYGPKGHIWVLTNRRVPKIYVDQVYGEMICTRKDLIDFASFDPRIYSKRPELGHVTIRVEKNELLCASVEDMLAEFENELIKRLIIIGIDPSNKLHKK